MVVRRWSCILVAMLVLIIGACADEGTRSTRRIVDIETTLGTIRLELDPEKAPVTVDNFLRYVDAGFYEGTIIHRVIPGFVIQGGGFTGEMTPRSPTRPPIPLECPNGLRNVRGAVGMARGSYPDSATTQFFINLSDNPSLDYNPAVEGANGYAVFGKVIDGLAVVDSIARVPTGVEGPYRDVPIVPIVIRSVR